MEGIKANLTINTINIKLINKLVDNKNDLNEIVNNIKLLKESS